MEKGEVYLVDTAVGKCFEVCLDGIGFGDAVEAADADAVPAAHIRVRRPAGIVGRVPGQRRRAGDAFSRSVLSGVPALEGVACPHRVAGQGDGSICDCSVDGYILHSCNAG